MARDKPAMRFHVGPWQYRMRLTEGPLIFDGSHVLGACIQSPREILIAADCPADDRLRVLLRELTRAWTFETGVPRDREGWLDLAASMTMAALVDLNNQGGELALLSLRPGESPEPVAAKIGLTRTRRCGTCGGDVAGGDVDCRIVATGICELRLYCEFCNVTQTWREAQGARGLPTGIAVGEGTREPGDGRPAKATAS